MKLRISLVAFGLLSSLLVFVPGRVRTQSDAVRTQQAVSDLNSAHSALAEG